MIDATALLEEYGITVIGKSAYPEPGQTRAPQTVNRILTKHGEAHTRMVLSTIAETRNNGLCLDHAGLWCASDMVRVCGPVIEQDTSAWLEFWDRLPMLDLQDRVQLTYGGLPGRYLLGGMVLERIIATFGPGAIKMERLNG